MKILHVSTADFAGGAARAAYRIHRAQVSSGIDSHLRVLHSGSGDPRVLPVARSLNRRLLHIIQHRWLAYSQRSWVTDNPVFHTFGEVSAGLVDELNASDADVLNLHWISGLLSVADIGQLRKPVVWTLHDMWAFCGGEHYVPEEAMARFRQGYRSDNRPPGECGPDLNRQTWEAKRRAWNGCPFTIVTPSRWLTSCAEESILFSGLSVHVIPNCLNTYDVWRPIPRDAARKALHLPLNKRLLLMGAVGGIADPRKGGDLLRKTVAKVAARQSGDVELMIYGQSRSENDEPWPCPVHWLGEVRDDRVLALAYSAADVMVVPSRQEAFGQSASEAFACSTPVATFDVGGLPDIVTHQESGWLAKAFDTDDLAEGILWLIADETRHAAISMNARKSAEAQFSEVVVAAQYVELYQHVLAHPDA